MIKHEEERTSEGQEKILGFILELVFANTLRIFKIYIRTLPADYSTVPTQIIFIYI